MNGAKLWDSESDGDDGTDESRATRKKVVLEAARAGVWWVDSAARSEEAGFASVARDDRVAEEPQAKLPRKQRSQNRLTASPMQSIWYTR